MPQFKVHVCRTSYQHLDIPVHAESKEQAEEIAINEAGNQSFPTENASHYTVEGIREVPS
jgi:hypothetical protein